MTPIEARTLRLEPLLEAHADEMFPPLSAAEIYQYMPGQPPESASALRQRYARLETRRSADGHQRWLNWIIRLKSQECVGFVQATIHSQLTADFAYVLAPGHWGRGVAFEACQAALPRLHSDFEVRALFATVDPRNSRSIRLLQRLGFDEVPPAFYPHGKAEPGDRVFSLTYDA